MVICGFCLLLFFISVKANADYDDLLDGFDLVDKVDWSIGKNMLAVHKINVNKNAEHLSSGSIKGMEDAMMTYFYGTGHPNMQIRFHRNESTGAGLCRIGIIPDQTLTALQKVNGTDLGCEYECKRRGYTHEADPTKPKRPTPFCHVPEESLEGRMEWHMAEGSYEMPTKEPQCLYDVYQAAIKHDEYDLFSYCARAYFFNGRQYTDPSRFWMREDWMLHLVEGRVTCEASGNVEADRELLARGYTVELVQKFDRHRYLVDEAELCPEMEAKLVAYSDRRKDGRFILAAVVGAGQLDFKDGGQPSFWDKKRYSDDYATWNLDKRACYLLYHKMLHRNDEDFRVKDRWNLELRVTHHCTKRTMKQTVSFDVSVRNNPERVHEDRGIQIAVDLEGARLTRTTGQVLCNNLMKGEMPSSLNATNANQGTMGSGVVCEPPTLFAEFPENRFEENNCYKPFDCPLGSRCLLDRKLDDGGEPRCLVARGPEEGCDGDDYCPKFHACYKCLAFFACSSSYKEECRWVRMYEEGEPCLIHQDCYPNHLCAGREEQSGPATPLGTCKYNGAEIRKTFEKEN